MKVIDAHCDALYKMYHDRHITLQTEGRLDVTLKRMKQSNVMTQAFAIYISEHIKHPNLGHIKQYVDLFQQHVMGTKKFKHIKYRSDIEDHHLNGKIGALLTLEGADALYNENLLQDGLLANLNFIFKLGVRSIGLTWNHANWAADGVQEEKHGGLSHLGKWFVKHCNRMNIILDVSHLSEKGFWQLCDMATKPFIASHSNAYAICKHRRNLTNEQITAMIKHKGMIGLTFVPMFLNDNKRATIDDILRHVDHVCSLGGENQLGFGSDFDGIDDKVIDLEHPGQYYNLYNKLYKHFNANIVERLLWRNWYDFLRNSLPLI